jgi:predicted metalloprotease with PDZ domain
MLAFGVAHARADVAYRVDLADRAAHTATVEMTVRGAPSPLELWMPAWTPGAYELRHWGRNVTPLGAEDAGGRALAFHRVGPDTFRVEGAAPGATIKLRYRVYAAQLSDDASQLDGTHAYLNGTSLFLAARGTEKTLHHVTATVPAGWRAATALDDAGSGWEALGYEALIDAPIEIGKFAEAETRAAGRVYRVVVDGLGEVPATFMRDVAAIAEAEAHLVGSPPYRRYLLLVHLSDGIGRIAALEHAASTSIVVPHRSFGGGDGYDELLYVVSHELFHAWNARRLRPADLVPYDLSHEQRSRALWITEGLTEYYAHRALKLSGLWTRARYLDRLGEQATRAVASARRGLSVEDEAELTWQPPDESAGDPDAYYARGHLVALALDALIRVGSDGHRSLDEVMRALLAEADLQNAPLAVDGDKLAAAVREVAGPDAAAKVIAWTRAPGEPDKLADALAGVGLKLVIEESPQRTFAGFAAESDGGALRVVSVGASGPAADAGLRAGDRIVRLDGEVPSARWGELLAKKSPGAAVAVEAVRATRRLLLELHLEATRSLTVRLEETPASPRALALRTALLGR